MVEFRDTDAAGVMHFSRHFLYMEETECAFLRSLGFSVMMTGMEPPIVWPRAAATCEYYRPCRFEETLDIRLRVLELGEKHMVYEYFFSRDGKKIALGTARVVCCEFGNGKLKSVAIPPVIAKPVSAYVHAGQSAPET
jgi:YbgC/YbaW family acyl-CoA thioester hydrolase